MQSEQKWKMLADLATSKCEFALAQECLHQAQDFGALLLLASSAGNTGMVEKLGDAASAEGQNNVAFLSYFSLGQYVTIFRCLSQGKATLTCLFCLCRLEKCLELLVNTGRLPEAAFFARTYLPSQVSR